VLSDKRIQQLEGEAKTKARALDNEALRHEAALVEREYNQLGVGDARAELGIFARIYLLELGRRRLLSR
jgi:hypothetical protein